MIDNKSIRKEIKAGLKNKTILTEDDARIIAKKYISDDEKSYEITIAISDLLPKKVKTIIANEPYNHTWFVGITKNIVFVDEFGRIWSRTKGVLKNDIETTFVNGHYIIKKLGGMVWRSKKGRTFICEYRTNKDEMNDTIAPQTFVG